MDIIKEYIVMQTIKARELKEKYPQMSDNDIDIEVGSYMNNYIDGFIEVITRLAYVLIYSADEKIEEYEKWLKNIKNLKIDDDWVVEVTELAVNCFC